MHFLMTHTRTSFLLPSAPTYVCVHVFHLASLDADARALLTVPNGRVEGLSSQGLARTGQQRGDTAIIMETSTALRERDPSRSLLQGRTSDTTN